MHGLTPRRSLRRRLAINAQMPKAVRSATIARQHVQPAPAMSLLNLINGLHHACLMGFGPGSAYSAMIGKSLTSGRFKRAVVIVDPATLAALDGTLELRLYRPCQNRGRQKCAVYMTITFAP